MDDRRPLLGSALAVAALALAFRSPATEPGATTAVPDRDPRAGVVGLLLLPELYGTEACQRFRPTPVPVYPAAGSATPGGELRTLAPWTYPAEGGCEGLAVGYVPAAGGTPEPLPAAEYGAEQPAALVLEARGDWYRIRLPHGDGWVQAGPRDEFGPLVALVRREPAALVHPDAELVLRSTPAAAADVAWRGVAHCALARVRDVDGEPAAPWLEVELVRDPCCADEAPGEPAGHGHGHGWLPLYGDEGVPQLWFAPRGC
jgi:hypothetical protein